jgi:hypothetical protein
LAFGCWSKYGSERTTRIKRRRKRIESCEHDDHHFYRQGHLDAARSLYRRAYALTGASFLLIREALMLPPMMRSPEAIHTARTDFEAAVTRLLHVARRQNEGPKPDGINA